MSMNAHENALEQFNQAMAVLGLTINQVAMIKDPRKVIELNLPMRVAASIVGITRVTCTAELRGLCA